MLCIYIQTPENISIVAFLSLYNKRFQNVTGRMKWIDVYCEAVRSIFQYSTTIKRLVKECNQYTSVLGVPQIQKTHILKLSIPNIQYNGALALLFVPQPDIYGNMSVIRLNYQIDASIIYILRITTNINSALHHLRIINVPNQMQPFETWLKRVYNKRKDKISIEKLKKKVKMLEDELKKYKKNNIPFHRSSYVQNERKDNSYQDNSYQDNSKLSYIDENVDEDNREQKHFNYNQPYTDEYPNDDQQPYTDKYYPNDDQQPDADEYDPDDNQQQQDYRYNKYNRDNEYTYTNYNRCNDERMPYIDERSNASGYPNIHSHSHAPDPNIHSRSHAPDPNISQIFSPTSQISHRSLHSNRSHNDRQLEPNPDDTSQYHDIPSFVPDVTNISLNESLYIKHNTSTTYIDIHSRDNINNIDHHRNQNPINNKQDNEHHPDTRQIKLEESDESHREKHSDEEKKAELITQNPDLYSPKIKPNLYANVTYDEADNNENPPKINPPKTNPDAEVYEYSDSTEEPDTTKK